MSSSESLDLDPKGVSLRLKAPSYLGLETLSDLGWSGKVNQVLKAASGEGFPSRLCFLHVMDKIHKHFETLNLRRM